MSVSLNENRNQRSKKNVERCKYCLMVSLTDFSTKPSTIGDGAFELDWTFQTDIARSQKYRDRVHQHKPDAVLKGLPTVSARDLRSTDEVKIPAQNMNLNQMKQAPPKMLQAVDSKPAPKAPAPAAATKPAPVKKDSKPPVQLRRVVPSKAVIRR
jgi:hypothetical protein